MKKEEPWPRPGVREGYACPDPTCVPACIADCRTCLENRVRKHLASLPVYKHTFKNNVTTGYTTMYVVKVKKGFRVYDHCEEGLSPDGTGMDKIVSNKERAIWLAEMYGSTLE